MKTRPLFLMGGLFLTLTAHAHGEHIPHHGGQVVEAGDYTLEWVAQENALYLSDHEGKEVSTEGVSGKIIAVGGGNKTTVMLTPAGGNRLKLSEPLPTGNEVKAVISDYAARPHASASAAGRSEVTFERKAGGLLVAHAL